MADSPLENSLYDDADLSVEMRLAQENGKLLTTIRAARQVLESAAASVKKNAAVKAALAILTESPHEERRIVITPKPVRKR